MAKPIEIFMPPNVLKAKVGSGGIDPSMVRRAEQVMEDLKEEFGQWVIKDVDNLARAHEAFAAHRNALTRDAFFRAAHDLRGQAQTFEFPLAARIANSLANLTDGQGDGTSLPMVLIEAHVDAIRLIIREQIKDPSDRKGSMLASELEAKTAAFLAKHPRI
jgi:chemotaxis protein histidine kinase CheA